MAKTYGKASRVIVWLRETADNSDEALKAIRVAGTAGSSRSLACPVSCGSAEINRYTFCLGLESLKSFHSLNL
ncbi:hypothetical protein V2W45_1407288 [Cenococcum geophilum]